jgi:hypothetical protein
MLALAKFGAMSDEERTAALEGLTSTECRAVARARLDAEIHELEVRYEMTSAAMRERWRRGELRDTADTSRWLVLLSARGDR